jgi:hypothetical protein
MSEQPEAGDPAARAEREAYDDVHSSAKSSLAGSPGPESRDTADAMRTEQHGADDEDDAAETEWTSGDGRQGN